MKDYEKFIIENEKIEYLKEKDKKLSKLIDIVGNIEREIIKDPFIALVNSIVYQQLSFKAADKIWTRFKELVKEITPENILNLNFLDLRSCGLSSTKINYINNISKAFIENDLTLEKFNEMSDKEIIDILIKIKGIGEWTAEMFLIFCLKRMDILSYKDLGLRKGLKWLFNMKEEPSLKEVKKIKNKFSPYNTILSFYLWEISIRDLFRFNNIDEAYENYSCNTGYLKSPIGIVEIKTKENKIISLDFVDKIYEERLDDLIIKAKKELNEYFDGKRKYFDLPLNIIGTDFQIKVWNELLKIEYGKTLSYKDIAIKIGNEKASRAIGNANNKNKIAILIPCHRVIGKNGKLVGYEGGLWRKEWLLNHEKRYS